MDARADTTRREAVIEADRGVVADARRLLAQDRPGEAKSLLSAWIETEGNRRSPYYPEALYLRGNAKLALGDEFDSLYDYERVARDHAGSEVFAAALEREFDVAKMYLDGLRRRAFGLRIDTGVNVAEEIILRINERLPGSVLAERALLELADYYYRTRDLPMAAETYDVFLDAFPRSTKRPLALQRRAFATIAQYKGPRHDAGGLIEAKLQIEQFQREFPVDAERLGMSDALQARLDESAAEQYLVTARWYLDRGDEPAGRLVLTRLLYTHPTSGPARDALTLFEQHGWPLPGASASGSPGRQDTSRATP
ncbi:MAG: hypothetical protein HBSAPP03_26620 [Phycisphaerae bacterium]|nr:MAG: hypothetical protein HBSAPP03_26620 [Phycisphaerae bacterium]